MSESQTYSVDNGKSYRRAVIIGLVLNISASLIGISYAAGILETQVSNESHDLNEQQLRLHELAHEEHRLRQNISTIAQWIRDHQAGRKSPLTGE